MATSELRRQAERWSLLGVLLLAADGSTPLFAQGAQRYIVTFRTATTPAARSNALGRAGARLEIDYRHVATSAVTVPDGRALNALRNDSAVLSIVPDRPVSAYQGKGKPSGGSSSTQVVPAGVARVGVPTASSNGSGVGVAILDTGIDLTHADLSGTVDAFTAFGNSCQDDNGHGTHVAGIAAARDNNSDVIGVAPNAQLYCVKVLDAAGSGSDATVMAGLDWVLDSPAGQIRVVNLSLGRAGTVDDNPALHALVSAIVNAGITIVVAAGNDASMDVSQQIPAAYEEVISVASTTAVAGSNQCRLLSAPIAADTASFFSTDGVGVSISAPGEDAEDVNRSCFIKSLGILSTRLGGGTTRMAGTSMAAPHVSGIAARHYQRDPAYRPADIRQFIESDAARVGTAPLNSPASGYTPDGEREGIARAR
jgi:subtilisin family serine protease